VRILYRTRQVWQALNSTPATEELAQVRSTLTPSLMSLFNRMQASEQAHSMRVFSQLLAQGEKNTDLLVAALLHDVGKSRHSLRLYERVMIVLAKSLFPGRVKRWGQGNPSGWQRPFVVAEQHPAWGAEMVAQAGASFLVAALIYRHQENLQGAAVTREDQLLSRLQLLDDES
jgi:hypothetical protein